MSFTPGPADERTKSAMRAVIRERVNQELKWGVQHLSFRVPDDLQPEEGAEARIKASVEFDAAVGRLSWFSVLFEEVMEALCAAEAGSLERVREELVQVAAVAVAAVEDIDSQEENVTGEYVEIDGKYVWASRTEIDEARDQGLLIEDYSSKEDDDEGEVEELWGGGDFHHEDR